MTTENHFPTPPAAGVRLVPTGQPYFASQLERDVANLGQLVEHINERLIECERELLNMRMNQAGGP